jgi:hypothetical protein
VQHRRTLDRLSTEVRAMAKSQDRPRRQPKRKKQPKAQAQPGATGTVAPSYQPPMRQVEVIKPKRKEREPEPQEPSPQDEG